MDISMHGNTTQIAEAKRIIMAKRPLVTAEAKCLVVMGSSTEIAHV